MNNVFLKRMNYSVLKAQNFESFSSRETNLKFWNSTFDKGRLKNFVSWFLKTYGERKTIELLEQLKNLGFGYATQAGVSLGIDDLLIPPQKMEFLYSSTKTVVQSNSKYKNAKITAVEKMQLFIDTWNETSENLKKEVVRYFEKTNIFNPVYMMAFSGARGNISQVRQLVGMRGLMSDPQGNIIDFPIQSNFREGLTLTEYIISTYGARKGIVDTALRTATAGYLTRRLVDVAQHVMISLFDCKTNRGIFLFDMKEGNQTLYSFQNRLVGRVLANHIKLNGTSELLSQSEGSGITEQKSVFIGYRNQEISNELANKIAQVTKKAFVRSPLTCQSSKFVCQLCYGWSLSSNKLVSLGEAVGVIAGQSIGEPGTQLTMRTFHTGGVFSGGLTESVVANYDGWIEYLEPIPGTCIRTLQGKIAFLTKTESSFLLKKKLQSTPFFTSEQSQKTEPSEISFHKIPGYAILFARHKQSIFKKQIIAQFSSVAGNSGNGKHEFQTQKGNAEQTVYADLEGEIFFNQIDLLEQKSNYFMQDTLWKTYYKSKIWILSGKIYEKKFSGSKNFLIQKKDFVNKNTTFERISWHNSDQNIIEFGFFNKKVPSSVSDPFLPLFLAKLEKSGEAEPTLLQSRNPSDLWGRNSLGEAAKLANACAPLSNSVNRRVLRQREEKEEQKKTNTNFSDFEFSKINFISEMSKSTLTDFYKNSLVHRFFLFNHLNSNKTNLNTTHFKKNVYKIYNTKIRRFLSKFEIFKFSKKSFNKKVLTKKRTTQIVLFYNKKKFQFTKHSLSIKKISQSFLNSTFLSFWKRKKWLKFLTKIQVIKNKKFNPTSKLSKMKNVKLQIPSIYNYNTNFHSVFKQKYNLSGPSHLGKASKWHSLQELASKGRKPASISGKLNKLNPNFFQTIKSPGPLKNTIISQMQQKNMKLLTNLKTQQKFMPNFFKKNMVNRFLKNPVYISKVFTYKTSNLTNDLNLKKIHFSLILTKSNSSKTFQPNKLVYIYKKNFSAEKFQIPLSKFYNWNNYNSILTNLKTPLKKLSLNYLVKILSLSEFPFSSSFPSAQALMRSLGPLAPDIGESQNPLWGKGKEEANKVSKTKLILSKRSSSKIQLNTKIPSILPNEKIFKSSLFLIPLNKISFQSMGYVFLISLNQKNKVTIHPSLIKQPKDYQSAISKGLDLNPDQLLLKYKKGDALTFSSFPGFHFSTAALAAALQGPTGNQKAPLRFPYDTLALSLKHFWSKASKREGMGNKQSRELMKKKGYLLKQFGLLNLTSPNQNNNNYKVLSFFPLNQDYLTSQYTNMNFKKKLSKSISPYNNENIKPNPGSILQWFPSDSKNESGLFIWPKSKKKWNLQTNFWIQKKRLKLFENKRSNLKNNLIQKCLPSFSFQNKNLKKLKRKQVNNRELEPNFKEPQKRTPLLRFNQIDKNTRLSQKLELFQKHPMYFEISSANYFGLIGKKTSNNQKRTPLKLRKQKISTKFFGVQLLLKAGYGNLAENLNFLTTNQKWKTNEFRNFNWKNVADLKENLKRKNFKQNRKKQGKTFNNKNFHLKKFTVSTQKFSWIPQQNYKFSNIDTNFKQINLLKGNTSDLESTELSRNNHFSVYLINRQGKKKEFNFKFSGFTHLSQNIFPCSKLKYSFSSNFPSGPLSPASATALKRHRGIAKGPFGPSFFPAKAEKQKQRSGKTQKKGKKRLLKNLKYKVFSTQYQNMFFVSSKKNKRLVKINQKKEKNAKTKKKNFKSKFNINLEQFSNLELNKKFKSFMLESELKNLLLKNLKKKFLKTNNKRRNLTNHLKKVVSNLEMPASSSFVFFSQMKKQSAFFSYLPYFKKSNTKKTFLPSALQKPFGPTEFRGLGPFESPTSTPRRGGEGRNSFSFFPAKLKKGRTLGNEEHEKNKISTKNVFKRNFYSNHLNFTVKPGWLYVFSGKDNSKRLDSNIFSFHQVFGTSGKNLIHDITFEQNSIFIENCVYKTSSLELNNWIVSKKTIKNKNCRYIVHSRTSNIALLIRPIYSKIVPNSYELKNIVSEVNKNFNNIKFSQDLIKDYHSNLFNKQFIFEKSFLSGFPSCDFKIHKISPLTNLKKKFLWFHTTKLLFPNFPKGLAEMSSARLGSPSQRAFVPLIGTKTKEWGTQQKKTKKQNLNQIAANSSSKGKFFSSKKGKKQQKFLKNLIKKYFFILNSSSLTYSIKDRQKQFGSSNKNRQGRSSSQALFSKPKSLVSTQIFSGGGILESENKLKEQHSLNFLAIENRRKMIQKSSIPFCNTYYTYKKFFFNSFKSTFEIEHLNNFNLNVPLPIIQISSHDHNLKNSSFLQKSSLKGKLLKSSSFFSFPFLPLLRLWRKSRNPLGLWRKAEPLRAYGELRNPYGEGKAPGEKRNPGTEQKQIFGSAKILKQPKVFMQNFKLLKNRPNNFQLNQLFHLKKKLYLNHFLVHNIYSLPYLKCFLIKKTAYLSNQRFFSSAFNSWDSKKSDFVMFKNSFLFYKSNMVLKNQAFANTDILSPFEGELIQSHLTKSAWWNNTSENFLIQKQQKNKHKIFLTKKDLFSVVFNKLETFKKTDFFKNSNTQNPLFSSFQTARTKVCSEEARDEKQKLANFFLFSNSTLGHSSATTTPSLNGKVGKEPIRFRGHFNLAVSKTLSQGTGDEEILENQTKNLKMDHNFVKRTKSNISISKVKNFKNHFKTNPNPDKIQNKILEFDFDENQNLFCKKFLAFQFLDDFLDLTEIPRKQRSYAFCLLKIYKKNKNVLIPQMKLKNQKQDYKINHFLTKYQKRFYKLKGLSIGNSNKFARLRLGNFVFKGDLLTSFLSFKKTGQIVHLTSKKITLRSAQSFLVSAKGILHVHQGDPIFKNLPVITLPFDTFTTGDIVQGIPKVEQYLEARTTQNGRFFLYSLPVLLQGIFKRYCRKFPLDQAVSQSFLKIQLIIVDGVQRVYRSQGVSIADKHLEVVVKQMTSKVQIIHGGQTGFFPGELVDLEIIERMNPFLMVKIQYEPVVLGITRASLEVESFLSAASFQQTTKILAKASLYKKKDFLKGLKENILIGNLIPAGTGYMNII